MVLVPIGFTGRKDFYFGLLLPVGRKLRSIPYVNTCKKFFFQFSSEIPGERSGKFSGEFLWPVEVRRPKSGFLRFIVSSRNATGFMRNLDTWGEVTFGDGR